MSRAASVQGGDRLTAAWLWAMTALVFAMIVVGGLTRLTDSGLAITEWRPVTGAIPPLSDADWVAEFAKYQAIPEYQLQNRGMAIDEFKALYWWEWGHRFLGRLIGAAFLILLVVVIVLRRVTRALAARLGVLFVLGALQGAVGWWMVASGLVERVDVSQYRLAVHLGLGFLLLAALAWSALDAGEREGPPPRWSPLAFAAAAFAGLVFIQVLLGAIVAGLDAGRVHTSWPLMDGGLAPREYGALTPFWRDAFENRASAQFHHRLAGYGVVLAAFALAIAARRAAPRAAWTLAGLAMGQAALGVWTLTAASPLGLAATHQALAAILFAAACLLIRRALRAGARREGRI